MRGEMESLLEQKLIAEQENSQASVDEANSLATENTVVTDMLEARVAELRHSHAATSIIEKVVAKKSSAITLSAIEMAGKAVTLRGVASTRADLIAFHGALREDPLFKTSTLPISDIAKSTLGAFTISIILP